MFLAWLLPRRRRKARQRPRLLELESLESRDLLATVTVNAVQIIRQLNNQILGTNLAWWDSNLGAAQTQSMVQAAGLAMFRLPGGSSSDEWHFAAGPTYSGQGTTASMASFIASVGGAGMVTLNYGTGSPQEAAAQLAYLNGSVSNTTVIGMGQIWNAATNTWVQQDWKTAGYWASLRAASPLQQNDGLNHLRIGRAAPFGFHFFEVGNEEYGSWETDMHGQGGDTGAPHDPATYVKFTKQFAAYAAQIDFTVAIGQDTGSVGYDNNWTATVLAQDAAQGVIPGFLSDHIYVQAPGQESDNQLLFNTVSSNTAGGSGSPDNWLLRAAGYRSLLNTYLGNNSSQVQLLATEFNSVYSNPGKQTTSLVNGLFLADSLGILLKSEYNAALFWDLRNGWDTANNNSASLYGWRQGGDYGLLGGGSGSAPATGPFVPYPTYFAEQLVSKLVRNSPVVVQASSNDSNLDVFAVKQVNGHLVLLVVNKSSTTNLAGSFQVSGFAPASAATLWQYGKTEDTAQSQTTDGHAALANSNVSLSVAGSNFSYTFPSYSMSVLDLSPATPTTTTVSASTSSSVYGQAVSFTATVTGSSRPTGTVEFFDQTTGADLGPGTLLSSTTTSASWRYTTGFTQLKVLVTAGHTINTVYTPTGTFAGSSGTLPGGFYVTPAPLTVTGITADKVYDGTTTAMLNTSGAALVGVISGDSVSLNTSSVVGVFASKDVGNALSVTVTGLTISGAQAGNYSLTQLTVTANITPKALTVTGVTAGDKVYDGATAAALDTSAAALVGAIGGDNVSLIIPPVPAPTFPSTALTGVLRPVAVAVDQNNNVFVADNFSLKVYKYAAGSTTISGVLTGVIVPSALAFDTSGNLYVAGSYTVGVFPPGSTSPSVTLTSPILSGINGISAMVFDAAGNLYVANGAGNMVSKFAPGATTPSATLTGLNWPRALAVDGVGNLYVANWNGNTVSVFAPGSTAPTATLTGVINPGSLVFDHAGNLFVSDGEYKSTAVSKFAPGSLTPTATLIGGYPGALAVDANDNVYVADGGMTIQRFAPGATVPDVTLAGLNSPFALVFDGNGDLFSANFGGNVSEFSSAVLANAAAIPRYHANFATKNVGASIPVTVTGLSLGGAQASNYSLAPPALTANITSRYLTVSGVTAADKIYDQTTVATLNATNVSLVGIIVGDSVSLDASSVTGTFASKDVGTGINVQVAGLTISGAQAANYSLIQPQTAANILPTSFQLSSFTPTPTGFTVAFNTPFASDKLTKYGIGNTVQDVTLVGAGTGPIGGTLFIDATSTSVTFKASAASLNFFNAEVNGGPESVILPDDGYTVTLVSGSGSNGLMDALGRGLDGAGNGGHADFVTTFTTHYQANATPVLGVPDFARGPDDAAIIKVPNNTAHGVPVTLYNVSNVTDATFALVYNPSLLNISAGANADATDPASSLTITAMSVNIDGTRATAVFHYQGAVPLSGKVVLGDLVATVPSTAKTNYKAKQLIQFAGVTVNGADFTGVTAPGVQVNAYFGDVSGDGAISAADVNPMFTVAIGQSTGFAPYTLLDPAIVGDVAGNIAVDGGDVAYLKSYILRFPRPKIPTPPGLAGIVSPNAADPTLDLRMKDEGGRMNQTDDPTHPSSFSLHPSIQVLLDDPHPEGSTGLTESVLALTYDPSVLTVSPDDITLGNIAGLEAGWQLRVVVDAQAGRIGIEMFSLTPIEATQGGVLVNIAFHLKAGASAADTTVRLAQSVKIDGETFTTLLADSQGALLLTPGIDEVVFPIPTYPVRKARP